MTYNCIFSVKNHFWVAFVLFFLALAACEDQPGCVSEDSNVVTISFFKIDDTTQRNPDEVFIDEVERWGAGLIPLIPEGLLKEERTLST